MRGVCSGGRVTGTGIARKSTAMTWKLDKETRTTIGKDGGGKGAKRFEGDEVKIFTRGGGVKDSGCGEFERRTHGSSLP